MVCRHLRSRAVFVHYRDGKGSSDDVPTVSGIAGDVLEAFETAGVLALSVKLGTLKAGLLHTAKDIAPPGPDYFTGYGLVQAAPAVRLAKQHAK